MKGYSMGYGAKYWDASELRIKETVAAFKEGKIPPVRRLAIHITNTCNMGCSYCNETHHNKHLPFDYFATAISEFSEMGGGIVHITGGEPSLVPYLPAAIKYATRYPNIQCHLNTNLYKLLPEDIYKKIAGLKVSLDSSNAAYFDALVNRTGSFTRIAENLKFIDSIVTENRPHLSITYTITKENYTHIPQFLEWYYTNFKNFYAVFFSNYKGSMPRFMMTDEDVDIFFNGIVPQIRALTEAHGDMESLWLFNHSHTRENFRQTVARFPANTVTPCYLSMSELLINSNGDIWNCSHLFRDGVCSTGHNVASSRLKDVPRILGDTPLHSKCLYGCNQKLVKFNQAVHAELENP